MYPCFSLVKPPFAGVPISVRFRPLNGISTDSVNRLLPCLVLITAKLIDSLYQLGLLTEEDHFLFSETQGCVWTKLSAKPRLLHATEGRVIAQ